MQLQYVCWRRTLTKTGNKALLRWGFFLYIYFSFFSTVLAQYNRKIYNEWMYFQNGKLNFNTNPISSSYQFTHNDYRESYTTICDTTGSVIFAYDGLSVYNKNYQIIPNGDTIDYSQSSHQNGLFLPMPNNDSLIYLFVIKDANYYRDFRTTNKVKPSYTILNKNLNNRLGGIQNINGTIQKRIEFGPDTVTELFTAIPYCDGYWLIYIGQLQKKLYAYKLTAFGLDTNKVESVINSERKGGFTRFKFKSSLDGNLLLFSDDDPLPPPDWGRGYWDWMEFDKQTGKVISSTKKYFPTLTENEGSDFGAGGFPVFSFSPNDSLIYYISTKHFDFTGNENYNRESQIIQLERYAADLVASRQIVARYQYRSWIPEEDKKAFRDLQLGPDGKIYIKRYGFTGGGDNMMAVIKEPNKRGTACNVDLEVGLPLIATAEDLGFVHYVDKTYVSRYHTLLGEPR
jgi:hypothetical protein